MKFQSLFAKILIGLFDSLPDHPNVLLLSVSGETQLSCKQKPPAAAFVKLCRGFLVLLPVYYL